MAKSWFSFQHRLKLTALVRTEFEETYGAMLRRSWRYVSPARDPDLMGPKHSVPSRSAAMYYTVTLRCA